MSSTRYPFVVVDALVLKCARVVAYEREVGCLQVASTKRVAMRSLASRWDSKSEQSWSEFFSWLKSRGLAGVDLAVSDHHGGLVNAVYPQFHGASWQPYQMHLSTNIADASPKALQDEVHRRVRAILEALGVDTARLLLARFVADYAEMASAAVAPLDRGFDDATVVLALSAAYRKRLHTTNSVERLNAEIRPRERVIRIFPNQESAICLLGTLLMGKMNSGAPVSAAWTYPSIGNGAAAKRMSADIRN